MSTPNSTVEQMFCQRFRSMSRKNKIIYPVPRDYKISALNQHYIENVIPYLDKEGVYVLHQVMLPTLFSMLNKYPDVSVWDVVPKYFKKYSISRNIDEIVSPDIEKMSIDFVIIKVKKGKISIIGLEVNGSQHDPFVASTKTHQIVCDVVKQEIMKQLGVKPEAFSHSFRNSGTHGFNGNEIVESFCKKITR